ITRTATRARRSASPATCLYSEGGATPARSATAASVTDSAPPASSSASAVSTTAAGLNPALLRTIAPRLIRLAARSNRGLHLQEHPAELGGFVVLRGVCRF